MTQDHSRPAGLTKRMPAIIEATARPGKISSTNETSRSDAREVQQAFEYSAAKMREISQMYQAAMRLMETRLEIIDKDLSLRRHRNPIHHIESRLKTPASIVDKLGRYGKQVSFENMERYILDIAGVRVICSYIQDVYALVETLERQDDLEIVKIKDYIAQPKPNGYRSLHLIVRIPVYFMAKKEMVPV